MPILVAEESLCLGGDMNVKPERSAAQKKKRVSHIRPQNRPSRMNEAVTSLTARGGPKQRARGQTADLHEPPVPGCARSRHQRGTQHPGSVGGVG